MTQDEFAKEALAMIQNLYDRVRSLESSVYQLPENVGVCEKPAVRAEQTDREEQ